MMKFLGCLFLGINFIYAQCSLTKNNLDEFLISNYSEFKAMGKGQCALDKTYRLTANINAGPSTKENCSSPTTCSGFIPVGAFDQPFTGKLRGSGYKIDSLFISNTSLYYGGIFSYTQNALIDSLELNDFAYEGNSIVGGLAGSCDTSNFKHLKVKGKLISTNDLGGVCGISTGSIFDSINVNLFINTSTSVSTNAGGVIGRGVDVEIKNSSTKINVTDFFANVGGFIGKSNNAKLTQVKSYPSIINSYSAIGGLIGYSSNNKVDTFLVDTAFINSNNNSGLAIGTSIDDTLYNGEVNGSAHSQSEIGGLIGWANKTQIKNLKISNNFITGKQRIGGVIGYGQGVNLENLDITTTISGDSLGGGIMGACDSCSGKSITANTTVMGKTYLGGIAGWLSKGNWSAIKLKSLIQNNIPSNSYYGGIAAKSSSLKLQNIYIDIFAKGMGTNTGGAFGEDSASIIDTITVLAEMNGQNQVGGIIGYANKSIITKAKVDLNLTGISFLGGLVGLGEATISNVDFKGLIYGTSYIGGVIGYGLSGSISNADVEIYITAGEELGGISGRNLMAISDCKSKVTIYGSKHSGGIAGFNSNSIANSSSYGNITTGLYSGGIAGENQGGVSKVSFNGSILGSSSRGGIIGKNSGFVEYAHNLSHVLYSSDSSGTLVGYNAPGGQVRNSYNSGVIDSSATSTGLIGINDGITENLFSVGAVARPNQNAADEDFIYLKATPGLLGAANALESYEFADENKFDGFDFSTDWTFDSSSYLTHPQLRELPPQRYAPVQFLNSPSDLKLEHLLSSDLAAFSNGNGSQWLIDLGDFGKVQSNAINLNQSTVDRNNYMTYRYAEIDSVSGDTLWSNASLIRFGKDAIVAVKTPLIPKNIIEIRASEPQYWTLSGQKINSIELQALKATNQPFIYFELNSEGKMKKVIAK